MREWKPSPTVTAVFFAGVTGIWVVVALWVFYDVTLDPVDVALNMAVFMTLAGWWTDRMQDK